MKNIKWIIYLLILSLLFVACDQEASGVETTEPPVAETESIDAAADAENDAAEENTVVLEGVGKGRNGEIKVAVGLDQEQKIQSIEILEHEETDGYWEKALEYIEKYVVDNQSLAVEAVSGATLSSNGILVGTAEALKTADINVADMGYEPPKLPEPSEQIVQTGSDRAGIQNFEYTTQGNTCSTKIVFTIHEENMTVHDLAIYDGCDGNARGFSALADGSEIDDVIERFEGITCHASDGSSCPDQVAKALNEARFILVGERLVVQR